MLRLIKAHNLGRTIMLLRRTSSLLLCAAIMLGLNGPPAKAGDGDNTDLLMGLGGLLLKAAQIDAARKSWEKVDPEVQDCFTKNFGYSPQQLIENGIGTNDRRVKPTLKACKEFVERVHSARDAWAEINDDVKACLTNKHNLKLDDLAEQGIGPKDNENVSALVDQCENEIAYQKQQERERVEAEARAKAQREARHRELVNLYGAEIANAIESGQVIEGMTKAQVKESKGHPDKIEEIPPKDEMWTYGGMRVVFQDGVVTYISGQASTRRTSDQATSKNTSGAGSTAGEQNSPPPSTTNSSSRSSAENTKNDEPEKDENRGKASVAQPIVRVPPQYPQSAASRGIEGWCLVEFTVTEDGSVVNPVIIDSEPPGTWDNAVKRAVVRWKYNPRIEDGKPVAFKVQTVLTFELG